MKKTLIVFSTVVLSVTAFGKTGTEAAGGISSDPGTKMTKPVEAEFEAAFYNKETKSYEVRVFPIGEDVTWPDVLDLVQDINVNLTAAAADSMLALAKIAYLEEMDKFVEARIDTLTDTTKAAIESLDTMTLEDVDNQITKVLVRKPKADDGKSGITYVANNIFNVAGAQADGKSITSNSQDRLSLYGLPRASEAGKVPYWGGSTLMWFYLSSLFDQKTIESLVLEGTSSITEGGIQIAGWNTPTSGDHNCSPTIASMLMNGDASTSAEDNPDNHLVLTRYSASSNAELHYTRIGSLSGLTGSAIKFVGTEGEAVVGTGAKTNTVTFAKFNDCNIRIKVESDNAGNATITFGVYYK